MDIIIKDIQILLERTRVRLPLLLDDFLMQYTPLPTCVFFKHCEDDELARYWKVLVTEICKYNHYPIAYTPIFLVYIDNIQSLNRGSTELLLLEYCDPTRIMFLNDVRTGRYRNRLHLHKLLSQESHDNDVLYATIYHSQDHILDTLHNILSYHTCRDLYMQYSKDISKRTFDK